MGEDTNGDMEQGGNEQMTNGGPNIGTDLQTFERVQDKESRSENGGVLVVIRHEPITIGDLDDDAAKMNEWYGYSASDTVVWVMSQHRLDEHFGEEWREWDEEKLIEKAKYGRRDTNWHQRVPVKGCLPYSRARLERYDAASWQRVGEKILCTTCRDDFDSVTDWVEHAVTTDCPTDA